MSQSQSTADILILGAGVIGASTAFHLARRRPGRVMVLERSGVAHGGSGRSSALIRMHYSYPLEVQLAVKSLETFRHWPEIVGGPDDFRQTGFIRIVPAPETDRLRANVAMQQELGVNTRLITRQELRELQPAWRVDDVELAAYEPDSGYGDGAGVATGFLARARELGVEYRPGVQVTSLRVEGDRVRGVETAAGLIEAPVVLVATGPWTRPLLEPIGVTLPLETEYHEVAFLKNPPALPSVGAACIDSILHLYFRPEVGGLTLVGSFYGPRGADPDHFPESPSKESLAAMAAGVTSRIPALEEAGVAFGVTGIYDMSPDSRPLLGEVSGVAGLHVAVGFSGMGFKISPAVGLLMSELLLDGRASSLDITPLRPGRFAEGRPIIAPYAYHCD